MSQSYWRRKAAPLIARVLAETAGQNEDAIRKALRDAYPFGERKYHPHDIWLDEIKRQRGFKARLGTFGPRARETAAALVAAGQGTLFEESRPAS